MSDKCDERLVIWGSLSERELFLKLNRRKCPRIYAPEYDVLDFGALLPVPDGIGEYEKRWKYVNWGCDLQYCSCFAITRIFL